MCSRILPISCVLLVAITLSGCCVGGVITQPVMCSYWKPNTESFDLNMSDNAPDSKDGFTKEWGKPDRIDFDAEKNEIWVYKSRRWCGIVPIVLVPIPLILPLCDGTYYIKFIGDKADVMYSRRTQYKGGIVIITPAGGHSGELEFTFSAERRGVRCSELIGIPNYVDTDTQ